MLKVADRHYLEAVAELNAKERKHLQLARSWGMWANKSHRERLEVAAQELKEAKVMYMEARRACTSPVLFLKTLLDSKGVDTQEADRLLMERLENVPVRSWTVMKKWLDQVYSMEILREGRLETMYFIPPEWSLKEWDKGPVKEMRAKMKRISGRRKTVQSVKLKTFYIQGEALLSLMEYLQSLKSTPWYTITRHEYAWSYLTFLLALLVVVLDMASDNTGEGLNSRHQLKMRSFVIGLLHISFSVLRLVSHMLNRQQKWLNSRKLPELRVLRRLLCLGPQLGLKPEPLSILASNKYNFKQQRGFCCLGIPLSPTPQSHYPLPLQNWTSHYLIRCWTKKNYKEARLRRSSTNSHGINVLSTRGSQNFSFTPSHLRLSNSSGVNGKPGSGVELDEERGGAKGRDGGGFGLGLDKSTTPTGEDVVGSVDLLTRVVVMLRCSKFDLLYLLLSVMGMIFGLSGDFESRSACYAFCLLDVSVRYKAMHRVLGAVSRNWDMLWQTALLVVVVVFIYAAVGVASFKPDYALGTALEAVLDEDVNFSGCNNLGQCAVTHFQYGLRTDLGNLLLLLTNEDGIVHRISRFIFDVSYWVLVPLLLMNMVAGIIIDSFAQLRDEEADLRMQRESQCVICGIGRGEFDRSGKGFLEHVMSDHRMWNYILVRAYLDEKEPLDHTGQESYIQRLQKRDPANPDVSYFPVGVAKVLPGGGAGYNMVGNPPVTNTGRRGRRGGRL
ncbi:unnamed protein product [Discosporangium mesarthrocarpum]